jgi:hypothetical protein
MKEEIKACPFCGKKGEIRDRRGINGRLDFSFNAGCKNKGCLIQPHTHYYKTKMDAIAAWNRRDE